jgi:hypothetical protein
VRIIVVRMNFFMGVFIVFAKVTKKIAIPLFEG